MATTDDLKQEAREQLLHEAKQKFISDYRAKVACLRNEQRHLCEAQKGIDGYRKEMREMVFIPPVFDD